MPNHVQNILTFNCNGERALKYAKRFMYNRDGNEERTGLGTFDFNKITRMPKEIAESEASSDTDHGIEVYLTAINPETRDFGLEKADQELFQKVVALLNSTRLFAMFDCDLSEEKIDAYTRSRPLGDLLTRGAGAVKNLMHHRALNWYDWSVQQWGTKWNSYNSPETSEEEIKKTKSIYFQTAWSPPLPVIFKLSAMLAGITITLKWADEDIGCNCGEITLQNGEVIDEKNFFDEDNPGNVSKEAIDFALDVWGYEPGDFGLKLSDDGTKYVRDDEEEE